MLKLASKFAMDILPSVIATVIGAYIVNHYVNTKSPASAPTAAAVSSVDAKKATAKGGDSKPAEKSADLGHEPGVRAKGISEKAIIDKANTDKAVVTEKPSDKADKPSETASIPPVTPAEPRKHQLTSRDKAAAKTTPTTAPTTTAPATTPVPEPAVAATAPPSESTPDANDLARAAIERLRGSEPSRSSEAPRVVVAPVASPPTPAPVATAPPLQPLPPPILVSTPNVDAKPPVARNDDPMRPTPPADIPDPHPPLDLRADAAPDQPAKRPSVADDVLSATKKLINSVLPKPQQ